MRAGGFIPPEMNIESTNNFTTTIQRHNEQRTIAIPILLSVTQRNVLLRPPGCLISPYSLRRGRRAGDIVGRAVNGYFDNEAPGKHSGNRGNDSAKTAETMGCSEDSGR